MHVYVILFYMCKRRIFTKGVVVCSSIAIGLTFAANAFATVLKKEMDSTSYIDVTSAEVASLIPDRDSVHNLILKGPVTNDVLTRLSAFPNLKGLDLCETNVTNANLSYLPKGLKWLSISGGDGITDAGIKTLIRTCPNLIELNLNSCPKITDVSIKEIANNCKNLTGLALNHCVGITNESLKEIAKGCKGLNMLGLNSCTQITNDGLKEIAENCETLTGLLINNCIKITDESIKAIANNCKKLNILGLLGCTQVTDESIKEIAKNCRNLSCLDLYGCTQITNLSVLKDLPDLQTLISRDGTRLMGEELKKYLSSL